MTFGDWVIFIGSVIAAVVICTTIRNGKRGK
jgi:hypothetical protein